MKMQFSDVDHGKAFDWGETSAEYAQYRDIYPPVFYARAFLDSGLGVAGQTCLDLGTGTGVLPRAMRKYGANWYGVDITEQQIRFARELAEKQGLSIGFSVAPAEETGFPDERFDVVTACQCFGYFDKSRVLPEICRILKPHGHFLVLYMAWLPHESEIARKSEALVLQFNPAWSGGGFQRKTETPPAWAKPYFDCVRCESFAADVPFTRETWDGRMYACRGIGAASLPEAKKAEFRKAHREMLQAFPEAFAVPHWISILDFVKKA